MHCDYLKKARLNSVIIKMILPQLFQKKAKTVQFSSYSY